MSRRQARRPYTLRKRAETQEATRRRILDAAADAIATSGFGAVTLDDVAARAGVTRVTVYRHVGSRLGLLEAVTWDQLARAGFDRLRAAREHPEPRRALHGFLLANCEMFERIADALQSALEEARREPDVARLVDATYHGTRIASLEAFAARLRRERVLAPGWTRGRVVDLLTMVTSIETFLILRRRRGYTVRRVADTLYEIASTSLAAGAPGTMRRRGPQPPAPADDARRT